jgi:hypothetical protein
VNTPSRREKLEDMLVDDPTDTFLRYALAMELDKEGQQEQSLRMFEQLMQESPPHVPSFLMAAQRFVKQGQIADARRVLRQGIEEARSQGENHAASEMSELLATLGQFPDGEG